ncbi:hypothetical protein [Sporosarcina sp. Te-1]|uniref:hypothetical protein n=1 Tax=Sporosarcina sp. Te-1 TaxID=2818390 RepID=UPI001A9DA06C|nr:hypothetical protein [Sporosarcina sp. Te-1]QTD40097.1 hypothetical protein J3U78_14880 [Sporosarcina sp. Te-1]
MRNETVLLLLANVLSMGLICTYAYRIYTLMSPQLHRVSVSRLILVVCIIAFTFALMWVAFYYVVSRGSTEWLFFYIIWGFAFLPFCFGILTGLLVIPFLYILSVVLFYTNNRNAKMMSDN